MPDLHQRPGQMRLLAVDPGGVSGLASWEDGAVTFSEEPDRFSLYARVRAWAPQVVVCENFVPRAGPLTFQPEALRIIGGLEFWCAQHAADFVLQTPAQAKGFGTAEKLKAVGWWPKGLGHSQDAARHLLVYFCTNPAGRHSDGDRLNRVLVEALRAD